jgi:hypothetical protein
MCFNEATSMTVFLLSFLFFLLLLLRGMIMKDRVDIYASIITLLIGSMQLVEFFLWKYPHCSPLNHFLSLLIFALLFLQPIIRCLSIHLLFGIKNKSIYFIMWISVFLFTCIMIYNLQIFQQLCLCSLPACPSGCRLRWATLSLRTTSMTLFWIFYFILFLLCDLVDFNHGLIRRYPIRYLLFPVTILLAILYTVTISPKNVFGSTWCFLALLYGPLALFRL